MIFFVSFHNVWKKKNCTHLFFSVMIIFFLELLRTKGNYNRLLEIVCTEGFRCVKRTLRLGGSKCSELAGQPCVISPQKTREKKRKTSTEEDRLECLAPHDASARTVATTFKLSVWLGLVGIFFIFKPSHEMFYISIVTSLLRSSSRFRLRSGYFSKDSLSCEARSA